MEELLECKVCFEEFDNEARLPKLLICGNGHTICKRCCEKLYNNQIQMITCPFCKKSFHCLLKDLNTVRVVLEIIETHNQQKLKANLVQTFDQNTSQSQCSLHNEKISLYCNTDKTLICLMCSQYGVHKGHDIVDFQVRAQNIKDKLISTYKIMENIILKSQNSIEKLQKNKEDLNNQAFQVKQYLNEKAQQIYLIIQETLRQKYNLIEQQLFIAQEKLEIQTQKFLLYKTRLENLKKPQNDSLQEMDQFIQNFYKIQKENQVNEPEEEFKFKFEVCNINEKQFIEKIQELFKYKFYSSIQNENSNQEDLQKEQQVYQEPNRNQSQNQALSEFGEFNNQFQNIADFSCQDPYNNQMRRLCQSNNQIQNPPQFQNLFASQNLTNQNELHLIVTRIPVQKPNLFSLEKDILICKKAQFINSNQEYQDKYVGGKSTPSNPVDIQFHRNDDNVSQKQFTIFIKDLDYFLQDNASIQGTVLKLDKDRPLELSTNLILVFGDFMYTCEIIQCYNGIGKQPHPQSLQNIIVKQN